MAIEITPGKEYGFFTDTSVCIGCKACEVACKEWNQLPEREDELGFLGQSLDNTGELNGTNWRHVQFVDHVEDAAMSDGNGKAFLLMSDVCKHCKHASCLDVCPTGAIVRTEFDTVFIQEDVCNGCRNCIAACPYDVIDIDEDKNVAQKCTLCYDRLQGGMEPACAKACPTDSIQFGERGALVERAKKREADLHAQGVKEARLYGADDDVYGGLNAFFLLMDAPETYNLPDAANAVLPQRNNLGGYLGGFVTAVLAVVGTVIARRQRNQAAEAPEGERP
jgi:formate dehydrogenase iron-sulfur subunit